MLVHRADWGLASRGGFWGLELGLLKQAYNSILVSRHGRTSTFAYLVQLVETSFFYLFSQNIKQYFELYLSKNQST